MKYDFLNSRFFVDEEEIFLFLKLNSKFIVNI